MAVDTNTSVLDREAIASRLSELQTMIAEAELLTGVLDLMDSNQKGRGGKRRGTTGTATRAGRGQRPEQFIAAVKDSPGITVAELAAELDVNSTYLYRLAKELVEDGKIKKVDKGYHPADDASE